MKAEDIKVELDKHANAGAAAHAQRFFKTGEQQYGAGDKFIGLRVPTIRAVCKQFKDLPLAEIEKLLEDPIHERRLAALIIMTNQAKRATETEKKELYQLYLRRTDRINNWDLVDVSCRDVIGGYLLNKSRQPLYKLARSADIWERRIAIVSTWQFIREKQLDDTFAIAEIQLNDTHDLIHKAIGWMLREAGKRNRAALLEFLDKHAHEMPRTALRYSIEHLSPDQRQHYMQLKTKVK